MMKKSFYSQQANVHKSQRAEAARTNAFTAKQDANVHQGRKQGSFSAPLKNTSRDAAGGYRGNPFKGLK